MKVSRNRGFTLLELLVSISIFSIIGLGANQMLRTVMDSNERVRAGPFSAVVVTMPRSEKIIVSDAPASSIVRMSRRSETPVALHAATCKPRCRKLPTIAHAAPGTVKEHIIQQ